MPIPWIPAAGAVRHQPGLLRVDLVQQGLDFRVIRAAVGAGGEGPLNECVRLRGQLSEARARPISAPVRASCKRPVRSVCSHWKQNKFLFIGFLLILVLTFPIGEGGPPQRRCVAQRI